MRKLLAAAAAGTGHSERYSFIKACCWRAKIQLVDFLFLLRLTRSVVLIVGAPFHYFEPRPYAMPPRARAPTPLPKQLMIKMKVSQRLNKEVGHYRAEVAKEEEAIRAAKDAGKDAHDVKQMELCMQETISMVPNSEARFRQSLEELFAFLQEHGAEPTVLEAEEYANAKSLLERNGMPLDIDEGLDDQAEEFAEGEIF
jgi:hypothetical protein